MSDYLTEEHYKIAESNGISRRNAYQRFYDYGWDVQTAITKPTSRNKKYKEIYGKWISVALKNGVTFQTFYVRLKRYGWSEEKAASTPPIIPRLRNACKTH